MPNRLNNYHNSSKSQVEKKICELKKCLLDRHLFPKRLYHVGGHMAGNSDNISNSGGWVDNSSLNFQEAFETLDWKCCIKSNIKYEIKKYSLKWRTNGNQRNKILDWIKPGACKADPRKIEFLGFCILSFWWIILQQI